MTDLTIQYFRIPFYCRLLNPKIDHSTIKLVCRGRNRKTCVDDATGRLPEDMTDLTIQYFCIPFLCRLINPKIDHSTIDLENKSQVHYPFPQFTRIGYKMVALYLYTPNGTRRGKWSLPRQSHLPPSPQPEGPFLVSNLNRFGHAA